MVDLPQEIGYKLITHNAVKILTVMPKTGGGPVGRPKQTNRQDARKISPKGDLIKWTNKNTGINP